MVQSGGERSCPRADASLFAAAERQDVGPHGPNFSGLPYERDSRKIFTRLSFYMQRSGGCPLGLSDLYRRWRRVPLPRLGIAGAPGWFHSSPKFAVLSLSVPHVEIRRR